VLSVLGIPVGSVEFRSCGQGNSFSTTLRGSDCILV